MKKKIKVNGENHGYFYVENQNSFATILYLHGGPGSPEYPIFQSKYHPNYLKKFNVIYYDHRGSGLSFCKQRHYDIETLIEDVKLVAEYVISLYQLKKVILVGHSFGSFIGIHAAKRYPDLFYFYVGISQVLDVKKSEEFIYYYLERVCLKHDDNKNFLSLQKEKKNKNFPTPKYLSVVKKRIIEKYHIGLTRKGLAKYFLIKQLIFFKEYSINEKINYVRGLIKTSNLLFPQLVTCQPLADNTHFCIPVLFIHGKYDYQVAKEPVINFFETIECPKKIFFIFEHSAHFPNVEEPDKFEYLIETFTNEIVFS